MMNFMLGLTMLVGGHDETMRRNLACDEYITRARAGAVIWNGLENSDRVIGGFRVCGRIVAKLPNGDVAMLVQAPKQNRDPLINKLYVLRKPDDRTFPASGDLPSGALFYKTVDIAKVGKIDCEVLELVDGLGWNLLFKAANERIPGPEVMPGVAVSHGVSEYFAALNAKETHRRKWDDLLEFERVRLNKQRNDLADAKLAKANDTKRQKAEADAAARIPNAKAELDKIVQDMAKSLANYKRQNARVDDDWYTQIEFTRRGITRHIEKLEQAKAGWLKMGIDQPTLTEMTKKANDSIALGKATLVKGSAK